MYSFLFFPPSLRRKSLLSFQKSCSMSFLRLSLLQNHTETLATAGYFLPNLFDLPLLLNQFGIQHVGCHGYALHSAQWVYQSFLPPTKSIYMYQPSKLRPLQSPWQLKFWNWRLDLENSRQVGDREWMGKNIFSQYNSLPNFHVRDVISIKQ